MLVSVQQHRWLGPLAVAVSLLFKRMPNGTGEFVTTPASTLAPQEMIDVASAQLIPDGSPSAGFSAERTWNSRS